MAADYSKKQTLQFKNGYAVPVPLDQPHLSAAGTLEQQFADTWTIPSAPAPVAGAVATAFTPKYVQYDKKVRTCLWRHVAGMCTHGCAPLSPGARTSLLLLCLGLPAPQVLRYFGWFGEPVPDSPLEAWRARKVCLLVSEGRNHLGRRGQALSMLQTRCVFCRAPQSGEPQVRAWPGYLPSAAPPLPHVKQVYLEDDTMHVTEPAQPNSGLQQVGDLHGCSCRGHGRPAWREQGGGASQKGWPELQVQPRRFP